MDLRVVTMGPPLACGLVRQAAGESLFARRRYEAGEPILRLDHPRWILAPRTGAVMAADGRFLFDPVLPLLAHNDQPNGRVSLEFLALIARRDIAPGEPLTRDWRVLGRCELVEEGATGAPSLDC
jgi:hypothetical protein